VNTYVRANISRWVDDHQPGFIECRFTDRFDCEWIFIEKSPVITARDLRSDSLFPQPAFIACEIVSRGTDDSGREIVEISTERPWSIAALDGTAHFHVFADQLTASAN
jgi:hypothetical protein